MNVKKAGKGTTTVIMNKLEKTQEEQILLDHKNNITPLENPMAEATLQTLRQIIEELYEGSYVDDLKGTSTLTTE